MFHVIVSKEVSTALWPMAGERAAVIALLTSLHNDLAAFASDPAKPRDPGDPD